MIIGSPGQFDEGASSVSREIRMTEPPRPKILYIDPDRESFEPYLKMVLDDSYALTIIEQLEEAEPHLDADLMILEPYRFLEGGKRQPLETLLDGFRKDGGKVIVTTTMPQEFYVNTYGFQEGRHYDKYWSKSDMAKIVPQIAELLRT
ncbi:MAG: hypothetical protein ABIC95_03215 [archaeon]